MIDKDKEYRTRDGRNVVIYTAGAGGAYPIHGATLNHEGYWDSMSWTSGGRCYDGDQCDDDLVEVEPTVESDLYVYRSVNGKLFFLTSPNKYMGELISKIRVEFEEGDGLDGD